MEPATATRRGLPTAVEEAFWGCSGVVSAYPMEGWVYQALWRFAVSPPYKAELRVPQGRHVGVSACTQQQLAAFLQRPQCRVSGNLVRLEQWGWIKALPRGPHNAVRGYILHLPQPLAPRGTSEGSA